MKIFLISLLAILAVAVILVLIELQDYSIEKVLETDENKKQDFSRQ